MNLSHVDSGPNIERNNDMTHDGKRFLIVLGQQAAATTGTRPTIQVVLNWGEELKQRVAAR